MGDKAEKYAQWIVANQDKKGTPEFETVAKAYKLAKEEKPSEFNKAFNELADIGVGVLGEGAKFAGRILPGVTGEEAQAWAEKKLTPKGYTLNAEAVSMGHTGADIGASFAIPGGLGKIASKIPQAAKYAEALTSGGMNLGSAATKSKIANALMRGGVGAAEGYGTGTLINPDEAWKGAAIQGGLSVGAPVVAELFKRGGNRLMMSAVKPDAADLESGAGQKAITTMLEEGVNPTPNRTIFGRGIDTIKSKITDLNNQVQQMIANSNGNVSKQDVLNALDSYALKVSKQLAPDADLEAIKTVRQQIVGNRQMPTNYVPVQTAQELKQGTYKSVGERAYGQESTAAKEAQKVGAKALKEGIERAVPEVGGLNKSESDLINMLNVIERKAYASLKSNPLGLAALSPNDMQAIAMMADRSAPFKALLARMMYQTGKGVENINKVPMGTVPAALATQGEQ